MQRHRVTSICAASVIAVGLGFMAHETAHVITGRLAGGSPTLLTAVEVRGNFTMLSPAGFVLLGASGLVVNALLAALGWWGLGRSRATAEFRLIAWFLFAVNGTLLATKTVAEAMLGWGDWMTILRPQQAMPFQRILVALLGAAALVLMIRRSGASLASLVRADDPSQRVQEARRIVMVGAAAAAVLVVGAGVASPVGATRGVLLGLGAGVGPFVPLLLGTRHASRPSPSGADGPTRHSSLWLLPAGAIALIMWLAFGPGIKL